MKRTTTTWKHRLEALAIGLVAALVLMGARSMEEDRTIRANRQLALEKVTRYFEDVKDPKSAAVARKVFELQANGLTSAKLSKEDFDFLVGVLHDDVDQLVVCRAVGILTGQYRQGKLSPEQVEQCKWEARRLFQYRDWVGRAYGFAWSGNLGDLTAIPGLSENVRTEGNPFARGEAEKALTKLLLLKEGK